jgi:hypothetical protein
MVNIGMLVLILPFILRVVRVCNFSEITLVKINEKLQNANKIFEYLVGSQQTNNYFISLVPQLLKV